MTDTPNNSVVSAEATGGAGPTFEIRAGAIALARLLRGDHLPGLDGPVRRVRFQQRAAGAVLDDLVFDGDDPRGGSRSVEYQVKRRLSPTAGDGGFAEIVRRCVDELARDPELIQAGRRRFGIATSPSRGLAELARLTRSARAHASPEAFMQVVRTTMARPVRDRLEAFRSTVRLALRSDATATEADVDLAAWQLAGSLYVWALDAEPEGAEVAGTVDRLRDIAPPSTDPARVLEALEILAMEWGPQAGTVDDQMLRRRIEAVGIALDAVPARRAAFERLRAASAPLLDRSAARLGHQLHLPRTPLRRQLNEAIDDHELIVVGGRAGVGKSILARLVAADIDATGETVGVLNLSGRTQGLVSLESELGVRLADALAGAPIGGTRVLVVDGAEQALTDSAALLSAVLDAVPLDPGSAPPWKVVLTARDEAVGTVERLLKDRTGSTPWTMTVEDLSDCEVSEVVAAFPRLGPIERNPRAKALLLRRPYLVDLLVRASDVRDLPDGVVGEEDLVEIVTERLVRRDNGGLPGRGSPDARHDIFLALAEASLRNDLPARLDGTDGEARAGLASDDVMARIGASWSFAHDVLADYGVAALLLEPGGDERLRSAVAPRRLLRAVRLRMQRQLADSLPSTLLSTWAQVTADAEALAADGPRWLDLPWEAVLNLGAVRTALEHLTPRLLEDEGGDLIRLIDVTERLARRPGGHENAPLPLDLALSAPVVDLLIENAAALAERATPRACRLVHEHLEAAAASGLDPLAGLVHSEALPDALLSWTNGDQYGDRLEHAIGSLALAARALQRRHDDFLAMHARRRPHEIAEAVESPRAATVLAHARPALLLRLAGLYYLGVAYDVDGPTGEVGQRALSRRSLDFDEGEGVRDHSHKHSWHLDMWPLGNNQSNPALGPFAALLAAHSLHGLRLIGAVVDAATDARSHLENTYGTTDLRLQLTSNAWPEPRSFHGTGTVWLWHRRTSVGPGPALSALMALRAWAVERLRSGDDPATVRDDILSAGSSLAFPAVALSALVDDVDRVTDEIDMFLTHPLVWHLEIARVTHEHGGTALDVPDATRLAWTLSNVAMALVLRGSEERRETLRRLGDLLIAQHAELPGQDAELLARRWAAELDIQRYTAEPQDEGIAISVNYPEDVMTALQDSGGARAVRSLHISKLMLKAIAIRDGKTDAAEAPGLWREVTSALEEEDPDDAEFAVHRPADIITAAAAALIRAASEGVEVTDDDLHAATQFLLDGASHFAGLAPPETYEDAPEAADPFDVEDMAWDMGADRSIATALPLLLLHPGLLGRAGTAPDTVAGGIEGIATSRYHETRTRLCDGLSPALDCSCTTHTAAHDAAIAAARRMLATSGQHLRRPGYGYAPLTLPDPVQAISTSGRLDIDIAQASFAVLLLRAAANASCSHAIEASGMLDVLIDYDQRVWPTHYARRHYHRTYMWRRALDIVLADRILQGEEEVLDRHLEAFAPVGEEVTGLLDQLAARASDHRHMQRVHDVWPRFLDRLLPQVRDLNPRDNDEDKRPHSTEVHKLDDALLLVPPENVPTGWPAEATFKLGVRWLKAFEATPHAADRAITFVGRMIGLNNDVATQAILSVLGDNIQRIRRESNMVVAWLQVILTQPTPGPGAARARTLLDRLAAAGDDWALNVQQQLEA